MKVHGVTECVVISKEAKKEVEYLNGVNEQSS